MKNKKVQMILLFIFGCLSFSFWIIGAIAQFSWQGIKDGYIMSENFMDWISK